MRIPNRFATMFIVVALGALPIGVLYLFRNSEPEKTLFPKPVAAELSQKIGNPTTSLRHVALSDNRPRLPSCTEESVFSLEQSTGSIGESVNVI